MVFRLGLVFRNDWFGNDWFCIPFLLFELHLHLFPLGLALMGLACFGYLKVVSNYCVLVLHLLSFGLSLNFIITNFCMQTSTLNAKNCSRTLLRMRSVGKGQNCPSSLIFPHIKNLQKMRGN
jgi:hypothetical protein